MVRRFVVVGVVAPALSVLAAAGPAPAASPAAERTCRGLTATVVGTPGDDVLTGTRGADVVVGLRGDDTLVGLAGDDVLCGGGGADDLAGGHGADRLYGGRDAHEERRRRTVVAGDLLEGGPGDDHLSTGLQQWEGRLWVLRGNIISFRHSARAVTVDLRARTAVGEGSDVVVRGPSLDVVGSAHDDVLQGSRADEVLDGLRGDDTTRGGGGADAVLDYFGDDELDGGAGNDMVISTTGVDTVAGGDGHDFLIAWSHAPTTLLGGAGSDYLSRPITPGETGVIDGGPGENQLELTPQLWFAGDPSAAVDRPAAGTSAVVTAGDKTQTTTFTGMTAFTLWGGPWTFAGSEGDDFVQVVSGRLQAQGLGGDDYLVGAERNDVLDGGDGTDTAWGGEGRNTCLATEAGSCSGYPWDDTTTRARIVTGDHPRQPEAASPHRLVQRWLTGGRSSPRERVVVGPGSAAAGRRTRQRPKRSRSSRYSPYPLVLSCAARSARLSSSMKPSRQATSSGQPILKPCRASSDAHEVAGVEQRVVGAGVEPGGAARHRVDAQPARGRGSGG